MNMPSTAETVKVFFIDPIGSIKVVMDFLIKLNFEVYSVELADAYRLVPLLRRHPRNVVYMCLSSTEAIATWLLYIDLLQKTHGEHIQFGVFVSSIIDRSACLSFLNRGVATIDLALLQKNTLETLKKILLYFEAREKRKFVRARALGAGQVYFKFKNLKEPVTGELVEISILAFSVKLTPENKLYFAAGIYVPDVTIILRGKRIRFAGRFMGLDRASPGTAIFMNYFPSPEGGKIEYHQQLPKEVRNAIYEYIQIFLREDLKQQLAGMPEERPAAETLEII